MLSLHKVSDHVSINIAVLSELTSFAGYECLLFYFSAIGAGTPLSAFLSVTCRRSFGGSSCEMGTCLGYGSGGVFGFQPLCSAVVPT